MATEESNWLIRELKINGRSVVSPPERPTGFRSAVIPDRRLLRMNVLRNEEFLINYKNLRLS